MDLWYAMFCSSMNSIQIRMDQRVFDSGWMNSNFWTLVLPWRLSLSGLKTPSCASRPIVVGTAAIECTSVVGASAVASPFTVLDCSPCSCYGGLVLPSDGLNWNCSSSLFHQRLTESMKKTPLSIWLPSASSSALALPYAYDLPALYLGVCKHR